MLSKEFFFEIGAWCFPKLVIGAWCLPKLFKLLIGAWCHPTVVFYVRQNCNILMDLALKIFFFSFVPQNWQNLTTGQVSCSFNCICHFVANLCMPHYGQNVNGLDFILN